jgi:hypothetical protein
MVIGFWDGNGFPLLIPGAAGTQTNAVDQAIATGNGANTHYSDYSLPIDNSPNPIQPDLSEPPAGDEHPSDCLGDFMRTSWSSENNYYGWSWSNHVDDSFNGYVNWANTEYSAHYAATTQYLTWGNFTWDDFRNEINAGRPFVILVDSDGSGGTDHFVTVVGWQDHNGINEYGCLDTWAPAGSIRWEEFRPVNAGDAWGIHSVTFFSIVNNNNPPMADAGPNLAGECAGATTPLMLEGAGSSDPDGDALTYLWTAAGITFDDPTSSTPIGNFPLGITIVTLTVSDGDMEDTDTVRITIIDTTPPVIASCAGDVTVECSDFCGTPWDDPQLTSFFGAFSATDVCCAVTLTNDRPDCFPLGTTTVTFTATDCAGNASTCSADVTVVDTTPPEISVDLNRDVLWPPNHKMIDITATVVVTDACCPDPTNWLDFAGSSEPDNHLGDGSTKGDIQGVDLGTADYHFQLRSERRGIGDGRVYTIIYTASDCVGNEASDTVYVRVPHDQSGHAMASLGFSGDGRSLDNSRSTLVVVVPSERGFNATALDPHHVYVGNTFGAIRPYRSVITDVNGDALKDLAVYYSTESVRDLVEASLDRHVFKHVTAELMVMEPIGIHYQSTDGIDYLAENIFLLGEPVSLKRETGERDIFKDFTGVTAEEPDITKEVPEVTSLGSIYPNPFNPATTITFDISKRARVRVVVFDAAGRAVCVLKDNVLEKGRYEVVWNGKNSSGAAVSAGVYFCQMRADAFVQTSKMVLLR